MCSAFLIHCISNRHMLVFAVTVARGIGTAVDVECPRIYMWQHDHHNGTCEAVVDSFIVFADPVEQLAKLRLFNRAKYYFTSFVSA